MHSEVTKLGCLRLEDHIAVVRPETIYCLRPRLCRAGLNPPRMISVSFAVRILSRPGHWCLRWSGFVAVPDQGRHIVCRRTRKDLAACPRIITVLALGCVQYRRLASPPMIISLGAACRMMSFAADEGYLSTPTPIQCRQIHCRHSSSAPKVPRIRFTASLAPPSRPYLNNCYRCRTAKDQIRPKAVRMGHRHPVVASKVCRIYQRVAEGTEIRSLRSRARPWDHYRRARYCALTRISITSPADRR